MVIIRTLLIIWFFWWIAQKLFSFFEKKLDNSKTDQNQSDRTHEFRQRNMDVQDAEFEELDESN